jgi:hypothetical protein
MNKIEDQFSQNGWFGYIDNEANIRWLCGELSDFDEGYYTFPDNQELFDSIANNINIAIDEENTMRVLRSQEKLSTISLSRYFNGYEGWGLYVDFTDEFDDGVSVLDTFYWMKSQIEAEEVFTVEMFDKVLDWVSTIEEGAV